MLLATALALLATGCAQQDVYCSKQTGSSSTKRNSSPIISLRFWNWAEEKLSMQPKFVAAQKMLSNRNPANIRKWIARFYYLGIYTPLKRVCIAHNNCMSCPSIWANSICTAH